MTTLPIFISSEYTSHVKVNDIVSSGQLIAQRISYDEFIINVAKGLDVSLEKARKCLIRKPGERIEVGDVLAVKKGFLGLNQEKIRSKVKGIFSRYERSTGNIIISADSDKHVFDIVSPVDGVVTMCDNNMIEISTDKDVYVGKKGIGDTVQGEVFVLESAFSKDGKTTDESEISLYYALDSDAVGEIVVGSYFSKDLLIKCIGMGAVGIVGTEIRDQDLEYIANRNIKVPIIEVDNDTIEKVTRWKGKRIYLNSQEKIILFLHS